MKMFNKILIGMVIVGSVFVSNVSAADRWIEGKVTSVVLNDDSNNDVMSFGVLYENSDGTMSGKMFRLVEAVWSENMKKNVLPLFLTALSQDKTVRFRGNVEGTDATIIRELMLIKD